MSNIFRSLYILVFVTCVPKSYFIFFSYDKTHIYSSGLTGSCDSYNFKSYYLFVCVHVICDFHSMSMWRPEDSMSPFSPSIVGVRDPDQVGRLGSMCPSVGLLSLTSLLVFVVSFISVFN